MTASELLKLASEARKSAYAPYSKFLVGAALLSDNGTVFTGCNVENASYGLTNCAERTAVFTAISEGVRNFSAIAISLLGGGSPCGACRQVLNEFNPCMKIYLGDENGQLVRETTLDVMLPDAFGPENLS
ncbi:cytidine deaminase [Oceaniferula spumae]|uniref:Cytidine deaminase n=1 Tax=Oceaniferula spumae TaxID=2979115 RepID=A0AAT9FSG7_9BACT